MIVLATPISSLFEDEVAAEEIIAASSCLECREKSLESKKPKQYIFHFEKDIVHPWNDAEKIFLCSVVLSKKDLKLVTFHMSASCSKPILKGDIFYCSGIEFSKEEMLDNVRHNAGWLKKCIGTRYIEIAVENNNYYPTQAYRYITDTHFISQVVLDNNLAFLFDLAHAKITAHNRGISYHDYIDGLPMTKMTQIHISKHGIDSRGLAYDAHDLLDEATLQEAGEIIHRFFPEYVTIEYYKDKDNLIQVLEECRKLYGGFKKEKI